MLIRRIGILSLMCFVLLVVVRIVAFASPQPESLGELVEEYHIKEYSVTAVENGTVQSTDSGGVPLVFEAGSVGKSVAAYLCLRLAEEGKLSLDDPIAQHL